MYNWIGWFCICGFYTVLRSMDIINYFEIVIWLFYSCLYLGGYYHTARFLVTKKIIFIIKMRTRS